MSLVRAADLSAYEKPKLYIPNTSSERSVMSTQIFNSGRHTFTYMTESYRDEHYDPEYLFGSQCEQLLNPSSSVIAISEKPLHLHCASSYQMAASDSSPTAQSSSELEYFEIDNPEPFSYDEDKVRLKLEELERALLDDNDDEDDNMFGPDQSIEIDDEWTDAAESILVHDSPKESSSSGSDLSTSSISSKKETPHIFQTPKDMIFSCATAISEGNIEEASNLINNIRQVVSIQGDPPQRVGAYMMEGLAARIAASGKFLYKALKCKEPPTSDRLAAMQILFEVCPCFKFGFTAANGAIVEAMRDERRVHIIDFDISQGSQYITLIQTLANRAGNLPHIRLTGVDDPDSVQRAVGGLNVIGKRLEKLAETLNVSFEFQAVASETSDVTLEMLDCRPKEVLLVNFAFQLHHMPDESVSMINQRDRLLRMVKSMKPKLVTVVEQDVNTNTAPFYQRFVETYSYYSAVFASLDLTLPRESQDRMNVEKHCLAREIINIVACEGAERIERYEVAGKWRARMMMAGFKPSPLGRSISNAIKDLNTKQYYDRFKVNEEMGALHFGWEDKNLVVASAWR